MRPRRRRFREAGQRRVGVAVAAMVCASLGVVGAAEVRADAQTSSACTDAPSPQSLDFLLPAWADQAGWSNPQLYETIQGADVDGDGVGELIGRNAANLEVFDWAQPSVKMGLDAPGQWTASTVPGPAMPESDFFFDPSVYSTVQAADLDGDRADEVFYRSTTGVQVFDFSGGAWSAPAAGPAWGDANALDDEVWNPQYYATIQAGDINGDGAAEIIGRTSNGIESWARQSDGTFLQLETPGSLQILSDAAGWNGGNPLYARSIRAADLTGDGAVDIVGRGENGLVLYSFTVTDASTGQGTWTELADTGPWTNAEGWAQEQYAGTLTTGDLDGDKTNGVEVVALGPYGLDVYGWDGGQWVEQVVTPTAGAPGALAGSPFDEAPYYSTIQTAELVHGQPAQVLARDTDGVHVLTLDTTSRSFVDSGSTQSQFSDANGWNVPARYEAIATVRGPAGRGDLLIGRDATGVRTYELDSVGGPWADPSASFPSWTAADAPSTEFSRAYGYINDHAVTEGGTVLGAFQLLTADLDQLQQAIAGLKPTSFNNFSRSVWNEVKASTIAWTEAVENLRSYLGVGTDAGSGVAQIMLDSFVTAGSGASINHIANYFTGENPAVLALIADLIWGALGAMPGGAVFESAGAVMSFTALMSVTGASVSAGMGFANTRGSVDSKAQDLQNEVAQQFCAGIEYLDIAQGQIAADLGLLTSMAQMMSDGVLGFTGTQYNDSVAAANSARQVWAFQQFASMGDHGWRAGWCEAGTSCVMNPKNTSGTGSYAYKALPVDGDGTPNCDNDPFGSTLVNGWSDLLALGADPNTQMFQPEVPPNRSSVGVDGAPYDALFQNDAMGLLGWRLSTHSCHS